MFSDKNRLKTDTLEYSWLLEILLGDVSGASSNAHLSRTAQHVHGVESLVTLLLENDY
jgi:hypothetical protein